MSQVASALIQKVWNYAHVMRDDGLSFLDYTEQITYLLFLKLLWERASEGQRKSKLPEYCWGKLFESKDDDKLAMNYRATLRKLSDRDGLLGLIFTKPQSKINDSAKLRRLVNLIDAQAWSNLDLDVQGEIYEGLLAKNAEDVRGGAGQYFTPRPVVRAIVEVMNLAPGERIADPACGTGGFLLAAHEYLMRSHSPLTEVMRRKINEDSLWGMDIVPSVARLCGMNLFLHGIGAGQKLLVQIHDSLANPPIQVDVVLTNPPFGKKSSFTVIHDDGKRDVDKLYYERKDFWATTSNKQLNFLQHIYSMLKENGRAAVVVPDNVLFEGGAGEKIRRSLLEQCDVHTLLRLPTGIWYSTGVKANVLFFDKRPSCKASRKKIWVYDLRTNQNFTLRQNPIRDVNLRDFVKCYKLEDRFKGRRTTERFRCFSYHEIMARDKANLDIFWLKDESHTNMDHLPDPNVLIAEILKDLEEAMVEFQAVGSILG